MTYDQDLAERVREVIATTKGVTEKAMFGGLAFLVDGHMTVAATHEGGLLARCEPHDTEAHIASALFRQLRAGSSTALFELTGA